MRDTVQWTSLGLVAVLLAFLPGTVHAWFGHQSNSVYLPYSNAGNSGGGNHYLPNWCRGCRCPNPVYNYGYQGSAGVRLEGTDNYYYPANGVPYFSSTGSGHTPIRRYPNAELSNLKPRVTVPQENVLPPPPVPEAPSVVPSPPVPAATK